MKIFQLLFLFFLATTIQAQQRNVVLIIADDLGADYLGFYENYGDTARLPNIRALLQKGVRFSNAWSNPICSPTRAGMLTGRYSFRTGVGTAIGGTTGGPSLSMAEKTLPQLLETYQPNIAKANIGKWHLHGPQAANLMNPNLLGYDHYSGLFIGTLPDYYNWSKITNGVTSNVTTYATTETVNDAIAWTSAQTNPFFLWLALNAPHSPFHLPPAGLHSYTNLSGTTQDIAANPKAYYKAAIEAMDTEIGRLFTSLKAQGKFDNTVFVFIGDNGTPQQTTQAANPARSKGTIYQDGVHVPMIISGSGIANPGRVSTGLVNTVDLFATILELFGYQNWSSQIAANKPVDSKSLMPILNDDCGEVRPWVFSEIFKPTTDAEDGKTMRNRDFKYLKFNNGKEELYNLTTDPNETTNLMTGTLNATAQANYNYLSNELKTLTVGGTNPVISAWLRNLTGIKGRHYVAGNPTPIQDNVLANVQSVKYSNSWVYVEATGIPSYITGPFLDNNPSIATAQTGFFKFPLNPVQNTGTPTTTTPGNIGAFINGVALYDYRDGVAWNTVNNSLCGGPGNPMCPGGMGAAQVWNRDAILAERGGFDCAKGHPAMGNYHHHQNPSAFNLDLSVVSNVCNIYLADGLYKIDSTKHSPLIGFAYDGFPIYGAYGYKNVDGTGGITRIKSGYSKRNITVRTHYANGTDVADGPPVSATYPIGYFREDYGYAAGGSDVLDDHNGRFCITPEYPNGTYCYFTTVDANWNSAYPYAVGPTFYGTRQASKVTSITEPVAAYAGEALAATTTVCNIDCFGASTGSVSVFVNGGSAPYSFSWSGGSTAQLRTGLSAGTYTVTITDAAGQTNTQTATITQPASGVAATGSTTPVACFGNSTGEIQLTTSGGAAGYTFIWNDGQTSQNRTSLAAGTYSVTITDGHGCSTTVSQEVAQPTNALSASATSIDVSCFGNTTGSIQLAASGGTAGYTYAWDNGSTNAGRTNLSAGTYIATVTDAAGCTTIIARAITQPQTALTASATITDVACVGGSTGSIQLNAFGGTAGYSYLWNNGQSDQTRSNLPAGAYEATITDAKGCTTILSRNLAQPQAALSASLSSTNVLCFGGASGNILLSPVGGTFGYTFLWNDGQTAQNRTAIIAGTYTVTITDANNCTVSNTQQISQPTEINATAVTTPALCGQSNASISLTVSGGNMPYSYQWNTGANTPNLSNLAAGAYLVTITDANSCSKASTISVSNLNAASAALTGSNVTCFGGTNGTLTLQVFGGAGPFTYLWNDGSTQQNRSNLAAGTYNVTVLDANGCSTILSRIIEQPAQITGNAISTPASCGQSTGTVSLSVSGGTSPYTYAWTNGANTQNLNNLSGGNYTVTIFDAEGCSTQASAQVTNSGGPAATTTIVSARCFGEASGQIQLAITGGNNPYIVVWNNGLFGQTLNSLTAGTYTATVTDASGCVASATATVTQPTSAVSVTATAQNVNCFGGNTGAISTLVVGGTSGYTHLWSNGATTQNLTSLVAGTYTATITDANGCTAQTTAQVTQPTSPLTANATTQNVACFGGSTGAITTIVTGGTTGYSFTWSNSTNSQNLTSLSAGTYTATITDANACTVQLTQAVTQPLAALTAVSTVTNAIGGSNGTAMVTSSGGTAPYTFNWSNGQTTPQITNLVAGVYQVTVTDANGCTALTTATVELVNALPTILDQIGVNVFPNPVSDVLIVQANDLLRETLHFNLVSENGQVCIQNTLPAGSTLAIFNTETLYDGIYFLHVLSADGAQKVFKVVVSK
jgi:arylsulfatase A-like enzyme